MARILLFLRFVFVALAVIFFLDLTGVESARPGRVWIIGVFLALLVMSQQSRYRRAPDGVMAFCRSMGVPDVEVSKGSVERGEERGGEKRREEMGRSRGGGGTLTDCCSSDRLMRLRLFV
jgi:hypothetical protein